MSLVYITRSKGIHLRMKAISPTLPSQWLLLVINLEITVLGFPSMSFIYQVFIGCEEGKPRSLLWRKGVNSVCACFVRSLL